MNGSLPATPTSARLKSSGKDRGVKLKELLLVMVIGLSVILFSIRTTLSQLDEPDGSLLLGDFNEDAVTFTRHVCTDGDSEEAWSFVKHPHDTKCLMPAPKKAPVNLFSRQCMFWDLQLNETSGEFIYVTSDNLHEKDDKMLREFFAVSYDIILYL